MAIYSFNMSNVSRATGASSCATLAYIAGIEVKDERTGKKYKYGHIDRIVATKTFLPECAAEKYTDPVVLINEIESVEKSGKARTAKKIIVALPRELSENERMLVLDDFVRDNITEENYGCVVAIHDDSEHKNPHAHILIPNRAFDENGNFEKVKRKMGYALDENGERIPIIDPKTGEQKVGQRNRKQWQRIAIISNPLDRKEVLEGFRRGWEVSCNKWLDEIHKIDHRSYKTQKIAKEATIHEGYAARKIEKFGGVSEKCEKNRIIIRERERFAESEMEILELKKQIFILEEEHRKTEKQKLQEEEEAARKAAEEKRKAAEAEARRIAEQAAEAERRRQAEARRIAKQAREEAEAEAEQRRRVEARAAQATEKPQEIAEKPIAEEKKQNTEVAAKLLDSETKMANGIVGCVRRYGKLPWNMPTWPRTPQKEHQKGVFSGFNQINLSIMAMEKGYTDNRWITRDFIETSGGYILRAEKAKRVFGNDGKIYGVYNVKQVGMLPMPEPEPETPKKTLNIDIKPENDGIRGEIVADIIKALLKQSFDMPEQPSRLDPERAAGYLNAHPEEIAVICDEAEQRRQKVIEQMEQKQEQRPEQVKEPERKEPEITKIQKKEKNWGFER